MDSFEKLSLSHFIWYLVPGLGLIFFILFPLLVIKPEIIKVFLGTIGPVGIIICGILLGFIIDGLRLYRLRPNYNKSKKNFFGDLQKIIAPNIDPYLIQSCIKDCAKSKNASEINLHHAIWIMLGNFTILAFLEAMFWIFATIFILFCPSSSNFIFGEKVSSGIAYICYMTFVVLFVIICLRFLYISNGDQKNTNTMFLNFAKQHRKYICKLLNITHRD